MKISKTDGAYKVPFVAVAIVVTIGISAVVIINMDYAGPLIGTIVMSLMTLALGELLIRGLEEKVLWKKVRQAFYFGLTLRIGTACLVQTLRYFGVLESQYNWLFENELLYDSYAKDVSYWFSLNHYIPEIPKGFHLLYIYATGLIYYIFGQFEILLRLFGATFNALIVPACARLAFTLSEGDQRRRLCLVTTWISAVSPIGILYGVAVMRDAFIALFIGLSALAIQEYIMKRWKFPKALILLCCFLTALFFFRTVSVVVFLMGFALWWITHVTGLGRAISVRKQRKSGTIIVLGLMGVVFIIFQQVLPPERLMNFLGMRYFEEEQLALQFMNRLSGAGTFRSSIGGGPVISYVLAVITQLLKPSPFWVLKVGDVNSIKYCFPGIEWYFILPLSVTGLWVAHKEWDSAKWLVPIMFFTFFVMVQFGAGLAVDTIRARVQTLALFPLVAARGMLYLKEKRKMRMYLAGLGALYFMVFNYYAVSVILPQEMTIKIMALFLSLLFLIAIKPILFRRPHHQ